MRQKITCPACRRENDFDSRFCIYCGTPLAATDTEAEREQTPEVNDEIRELRRLANHILSRLDALETSGGAIIPPAVPTTTPEPEVTPEPVPEPSVVTEPRVPVTEPPTPEKPAAPPQPEKPPRKRDREWEQILGGSWLARIGVLALIIGIGFFLKFAFDNNWLGPAGRVVLGIVAGFIMIGAGYYWRRRYPILTQVLSGGGIGVLYLSIFAAFALYDLIHFYVAIAALFLVSAASARLALKYNSMSLAIIGIIGAYLAPFILGGFRPGGVHERDAGQAVQLMAYIIIVDLGVLALSTFRNWRWFTLLALVCSLIAFGFWYREYDSVVGAATAWQCLTVIFAVFIGATTLFNFIKRRTPESLDFSLMLLNASAYFGISLGLLWDEYRGWMGTFVFMLALLYGAIAYLAYRRRAEDTTLSLLALGIALVFLTVALPVQIGNQAWTTIAWAAEGAVFTWLAFRTRMELLLYSGYLVFLAAGVRLIAFDTWIDLPAFQPVFNERFLAFIVSIAAMSLTAYLFWKNPDNDTDTECLVFWGVADFYTLWIIGAEVYSYSRTDLSLTGSLSLIILLLMAGIAVLHPLAWRSKPQVFDIALSIFNAVAFIIISAFIWDELREWMGTGYFALSLGYGILCYYSLKRGTDTATLGRYSLGTTVVLFTAAVLIQLEDTVWTTIAWAIEGAILIWMLHRYRISHLRYYGYGVFLAVLIRLIFFDNRVDIAAFQPVFNERFLAFIVSIAAIYVAGYLMLQGNKISARYQGDTALYFLFANLLTLWLISMEVWNYFDGVLLTADRAARSGLHDAQNLSLTGVWAIYAVICLVIGILKRWRYLRLGALALLVIPIGKVFVYDVFQLELAYRIGAFVGLGLLLLLSAYFYQRYSKAIKGVFMDK